MSDFTAHLIEPVLLDSLRWISISIINAPVIQATMGLGEPTALASHSRAAVIPAMPAYDRAMSKVPTFLDDYYYRIHVMPRRSDLGAILAPVIIDLLVWNAHFVSKTCSAINTTGDDAITIAGLTAPFTLPGLAHGDYTITVPVEGDPNVANTFVFVFGDESPIIIITGIRLTLFPWRPQAGVTEALNWLSDVLTATDGTEQRMALRLAPRQEFSFRMFLDGTEKPRLEAIIARWLKRGWGLPIWTELVDHAADLPVGTTTISLDTRYADFRAGGLAVLWQSESYWEVVTILSKTDSSIVLKSPTAKVFNGQKVIAPVRVSMMKTKFERSEHSSGVFRADAEFRVVDNIEVAGYTPDTTYEGLPVIFEPIYIDESRPLSSDADVFVNDFETGVVSILSTTDSNIDTQGHRFCNDTKQACWIFRQLLHALKGQRGALWLPTFNADFILLDTIGATETTLSVQNNGYIPSDIRCHVMFTLTDGTRFYRRITGVTEVSSSEMQLSIDSSLGRDVAPAECLICFLDKCRLNADRVEIRWDMAHQNTSDVNFRRVKA